MQCDHNRFVGFAVRPGNGFTQRDFIEKASRAREFFQLIHGHRRNTKTTLVRQQNPSFRGQTIEGLAHRACAGTVPFPKNIERQFLPRQERRRYHIATQSLLDARSQRRCLPVLGLRASGLFLQRHVVLEEAVERCGGEIEDCPPRLFVPGQNSKTPQTVTKSTKKSITLKNRYPVSCITTTSDGSLNF